MAITIDTSGTPNITPAATFDVAVPAHASGDVLVLMVFKREVSSPVPAISTSGWTEQVSLPGSTGGRHILIGTKVGNGSETTVRVTNMAAAAGLYAKVYVCVGADTTTPVVGTGNITASGTTTGAITTTGSPAAGDAGFAVCAFAGSTSGHSASDGYTLDVGASSGCVSYKALDSGTEDTSFSWTTSRAFTTALIVIKQAAAATITIPSATMTLAAIAPSVTASGTATITTTPGVMAINPVAATLTPGPVTITIPPATFTLDAVAAAITPGPATITVPAPTMTIAGVAGTVAASGTATITVPAAVMTIAGVAPSVGTPGLEITVPPATMTLAAVAPSVAASGTATITVPAPAMTIAGVAGTVAASGTATITVPPATFTLTAASMSLGGPLNPGGPLTRPRPQRWTTAGSGLVRGD